MSAHEFTFRPLIGDAGIALKSFAGHPVLIVNTASHCGYTPQYRGLQELYERYAPRGLTVIGVPSNDFGAQEPFGADAIQHFCKMEYAVSFPLTEKTAVVEGDIHPFYRWLEAQLGADGRPRWNFTKVLIDGKGEIAGLWPSRITPTDPAIVAAIESALGEA